MNPDAIEAAIPHINSKKIVFGHKSVGKNILEGVSLISDNKINIQQLQGSVKPGINEFKVGENLKPIEKINNFYNVIKQNGDEIEIAMMKLCFVDFVMDANVDEIFNHYKDTILKIKKEFPQIKIIHITTPLTEKTPGWKKLVFKVIGREDKNETVNDKRLRYNSLLKDFFANDLIFDLAFVESNSKDINTKKKLYLAGDFSADGAHLNTYGKKVVGLKFIEFLENM
ncbi:MAG: hypothetical protein Kow00108_00330 [Calditrichia bacterium]